MKPLSGLRILDFSRQFRSPRLGPDGSRLAVVMGEGPAADLWLVEPNATLTRLSFGLRPHAPAWRPDGRAVTVSASVEGRWRLLTLSPDGTPPVVLHESRHRLYPDGWSPDGTRLVFQEHRGDAGWDLWTLSVDRAGRPDGAPRPLLATPFHEAHAEVSPDGTWVAYESDELDGLVDLYVRSFPDGGGKVRLTTSGARSPRWSGKSEIFYWNTSEGRVARLRWRVEAGRFLVSEGPPLWTGSDAVPALRRVLATPNGRSYDVGPGGRRLLMLESATPEVEPALARPVVVLGFGQELRARLP